MFAWTAALLSLVQIVASLEECDGVPHAVDGAPLKNRFMTTGGNLKCPSYGGPVPLAQCLDYDRVAGTRCCDDDDDHDLSSALCPSGSCSLKNRGTSLCSTECELVSFATAKARCRSIGMRLCTTTEILDDHKTEGSGCGFDHAPVWTFPANLSVASLTVVGDGFSEELAAPSGSVLYKSTNGIYFDPLPSSGFDIEAGIDDASSVSKVVFKLVDKNTGIARFSVDDESAPFSLGPVLSELDSSDFILTATPFSSSSLEGVSLTVEFSVVDEPFNPIEEPIRLVDERGTSIIKLKRVASFPTDPDSDPRGSSLFTSRRLRINAMIPRGDWLYVCMESIGIIRRVDVTSGEFDMWFDVYAGIEENGGMMSNTDTFPHSGLRGLAFHDNFETNGIFYTSHLESHPENIDGLHYLNEGEISDGIVGDSVVAEWQIDEGAASYRQLFRIAMPTFPSEGVAYENPIKQIMMHKGHLYVCMGDGYTEFNDVEGGRGKNVFGKILRIAPDGSDDFDYSIPQDNPFINEEYPNEVYAIGFRNPHNIGVTERDEIVVVDVGRDNAEEVNIVVSGGDYGWNLREGPFVHDPQGGGLLHGVGIDLPENDADFNFAYPVAGFGHEGGKKGASYREVLSQSIAGSCPLGTTSGSELDGRFFYGDFPQQGPIYYSYLDDMRSADTRGDSLTQAPTYLSTIEYYDENDNLVMTTIHFRDIVNYEAERKGRGEQTRNDMRFGCGPSGELLISSKRDGNIYTVLNSHPVNR